MSGDGNTVVIGDEEANTNFTGTAENDAGSAQVYRYNGSNWIKLGDNITALGNFTGQDVSISQDGSRIAISSSNAVEVFDWNAVTNTWDLVGDTITGAGEDFGEEAKLSEDGTVLAIGAPRGDGDENNEGVVRVFKYNGTEWEPTRYRYRRG